MSAPLVEDIGRTAESMAVEAAWSQWSTLTTLADADARMAVRSVIDPEALVLASLAMARVERRMEDLVAAWARTAGFLMSKPRFKSLLSRFPPQLAERIGDFARYAVEGGDSRWRSWARADGSGEGNGMVGAPAPRAKKTGPLQLVHPRALVLRLRAGFGVSAKADLLAMLLALGEQPAGLNEIAEATGYSKRAIRQATDEMTLAAILEEIEGRPSSFRVDSGAWEHVLDGGRRPDRQKPVLPDWMPWSGIFPFLCSVSWWSREAHHEQWSEYVASSRARDVLEDHLRRLQRMRVARVEPPSGVGAGFLEKLRAVLQRVGEFIRA